MRRLTTPLALLAATFGLLAAPTGGQAQQAAPQWEFFPDVDPSTGEASGFAVLGVPQTDDRALSLFCAYTPGAPMQVLADFTTSVAGTQGGAPATLQWQTQATSGTQQGQAFFAEVFDGISFSVDLFSPLMTQLESAPQIIYSDAAATGFPPTVVPLAGNRGALQDFTSHCAQIQQAEGRLTTGAAPLVPDLGANISGHVWSRFTQVSDDVFATVLEVFFAVPETDDVVINGSCEIGAQGPLVSLQVSADIQGLAENSLATLRIRNGAGQVIDVDGSVIGTQAEFGVSGIELVLEASDPAWLVIAGDPLVQFERLGSRGGFTLTGNGPNTIGPFLADCDQIDRLSTAGAPIPSAPSVPIGAQDGFLACDSFGRVASRDTGQPTVLTFRNESGAFRGLVWIDPNGTPVDQGGMNPGEQMSFTTDPGHVWMATDGPGNCREMIQPVPGQVTYNLLAR